MFLITRVIVSQEREELMLHICGWLSRRIELTDVLAVLGRLPDRQVRREGLPEGLGREAHLAEARVEQLCELNQPVSIDRMSTASDQSPSMQLSETLTGSFFRTLVHARCPLPEA